MNSLSWFLYLIDVAGNVRNLAVAILIGGGLAILAMSLAVPISDGDVLEWARYRSWFARLVGGVLAGAVVFCILPSTNTLYAIAASQVGEQIARNETVQDITSDAAKALQQWIKRQIEPETKK